MWDELRGLLVELLVPFVHGLGLDGLQWAHRERVALKLDGNGVLDTEAVCFLVRGGFGVEDIFFDDLWLDDILHVVVLISLLF